MMMSATSISPASPPPRIFTEGWAASFVSRSGPEDSYAVTSEDGQVKFTLPVPAGSTRTEVRAALLYHPRVRPTVSPSLRELHGAHAPRTDEESTAADRHARISDARRELASMDPRAAAVEDEIAKERMVERSRCAGRHPSRSR